MQTVKLSTFIVLLGISLVLATGCTPEAELRVQNATQRKRIQELESQYQTDRLNIDQLKRKLEAADGMANIETDALNQQVAALEEDLEKKKKLVNLMKQQLLSGGGALPVELSTMLEDFAGAEKMVTFDSSRGVVKFKSDLLFQTGSDKVTPVAGTSIQALCKILNSDQGKKFDIIIAGHTDDMRIAKQATRAKHPTNWHLSAHRAIAVLNVMGKNNVASSRLSIRGFGEFRPVAKNKPSKKGNSKNRRVEIYIVAKGM
ncbi:MAG: OmpA family protein [Planctomycetes bacterium]|nr:OmpA family protein [Planctomycetota bacterium]